MIWLILEAVLSVVLFLLIIWWTMPRKRDEDRDKKQ
jgi:phage shock protein PspC (stress-responsive transcriptional regulator)